MTLEAITFDLGGMPPVEVQLASVAGLTPLPLPDAIRRFQAAMESEPAQAEVPEATPTKLEPAPQILGREPQVILEEPLAVDHPVQPEVSVPTGEATVKHEDAPIKDVPMDVKEPVATQAPVGIQEPVVTQEAVVTREPVAAVRPEVPVAQAQPEIKVPTGEAPVKHTNAPSIEVPMDVKEPVATQTPVVIQEPVVIREPVAAVRSEAPVVPVKPEVQVPTVEVPIRNVEAPVKDVPMAVKEPVAPETLEAPVKSDAPIKPEVSIKPEAPVKPEVSIKPEAPVKPEVPVKPVKPDAPVKPEVPVKPVKPDAPVKTEAPIKAEAIPAAIDAPVAQVVASPVAPVAQPEVLRAEAASARTATIVQTVNEVVEAVAAQISVTPMLAQGEGEIRIVLKPTVLDGSEIRLSAKEGALTVAIAPATPESAQLVAAAVPRLETALAEHAPAFNHVAVVVATAKKGRTNETA